MSKDCYDLFCPTKNKVPILVSIPHAGTSFPEELATHFVPEIINFPVDTDWFVDQLYRFVLDMGVSLIVARHSRYVIDLNRNRENQPLYPHMREETALVPTKSFSGEALYRQPGLEPSAPEIQRRIEKYYQPYYTKVMALLNGLKASFGHALFFDAHSIKHLVPHLQAEPFHQITLSDYKGACSHPQIADKALMCLQGGPYTIGYNSFFLGGHLVRSMSLPKEKIYGLQLEMCQNIYMNEDKTTYLPEKASQVQDLLKLLFQNLIETMETLQ